MKAREGLAALIVSFIVAPLLAFFVVAVSDAETRASEAPFRAVLGADRFEAIMEGQGGFPHYLGNSLSAPDFTLSRRNGTPWRLEDQRGKVIVMNFWTITCKPCVQEMPTIETLALIAERWGDVEVVAVTTDENWDQVRSLIGDTSRITHLIDSEKRVVTEAYGTKLYPETWIIDRRGVVRFRYDGPLDWSDPVVLDLIKAFR